MHEYPRTCGRISPHGPKSVDLLSVDCEGMDLDLIKNFPFDLARPKIVLVEDFDYSEESEIHRSMTNLGYEMKSYTKITKIFVDLGQ
jgi:hypothetical protein